MSKLTIGQIKELFNVLDKKLASENITGELYLVGGAVMCLAYNARASTRDIDAYFEPASVIRKYSKIIAEEKGLNDNWLNDAVKGFLSPQGEYNKYYETSYLKVYLAKPEYLLAMKCLAMRIGAEYSDEDDVRYLLRHLNIEKYEDAISVVTKYYKLESFPQKTLYVLEEILGARKF